MIDKNKITIGLFVDSFFPMVDGVVVVVDNYAKQLSQKANIIVFAPDSRKSKYVDESPYQVVRSIKAKIPFMDYDLSLPFLDYKYKKILKNAKLDIVHIHSPFTVSKTGIAYAKKHHIPVVATLHSQYKKDFYERTKSHIVSDIAIKEIMNIFNSCDECWAVNKKVAEIFFEYGAKQMPKVQLNATDLLPFEDINTLKALRKTYHIESNEKVFLYVGRLDIVKNLGFTINALHQLKLKGFKFKMLFVGKGPYEHEMKQLIKKFELDNLVYFPGKIMNRIELSSYYALADLFVFPSLYDASSLVQIEAASQKTPTLFLRDAATADTITENVNGYISENDPILYSQKIIDIFNDADEYKKISERAFTDLYRTWNQATEQAFKNYMRLIEEKKKNMN
ncbi:MAG: glycosyltransferase [Acholeplasmataceae bacterium]|nr:glycosyltransferase [Acholeplasmataceae bacterium]